VLFPDLGAIRPPEAEFRVAVRPGPHVNSGFEVRGVGQIINSVLIFHGLYVLMSGRFIVRLLNNCHFDRKTPQVKTAAAISRAKRGDYAEFDPG
jgi:hypothetical protein